jgi:hypothetical protein
MAGSAQGESRRGVVIAGLRVVGVEVADGAARVSVGAVASVPLAAASAAVLVAVEDGEPERVLVAFAALLVPAGGVGDGGGLVAGAVASRVRRLAAGDATSFHGRLSGRP